MGFDSVHLIQLRKGDANDERAKIVELDNGDSFSIECSADDSYSSSSFMFLHNENEINFASDEVERNERRVAIKIEQFVESIHKGEYLCAASSSSGTVERTIVVKKRNRLNDLHYAMRCKENRCRNGGQCFVPLSGDRTPFCLCPSEYAGKDCDSHSVSSYAIQGTKATFGLGGVCTSALIISCILFAILYRREKRKRREAEAKLDDFLPSCREHVGCQEFAIEVSRDYINKLMKPTFTTNLKSPPSAPYARIESCAEFDIIANDEELSQEDHSTTNCHSLKAEYMSTLVTEAMHSTQLTSTINKTMNQRSNIYLNEQFVKTDHSGSEGNSIVVVTAKKPTPKKGGEIVNKWRQSNYKRRGNNEELSKFTDHLK